MRFCFDLDGTLVQPNEQGGVDPVPAAVELVRQLHKAKHTIIITTSTWGAMMMIGKSEALEVDIGTLFFFLGCLGKVGGIVCEDKMFSKETFSEVDFF